MSASRRVQTRRRTHASLPLTPVARGERPAAFEPRYITVELLVPIVLRFVRTINLHSDVVGLIL